ncbi:MAG: cell division protein FtsZ, partial [Gemmatimonadota bacterium]|nr:cell division protein FtsZ [Gemmatimonadota bacterium]
ATGVLVNITGGTDLTLGEVHQINEIVHDAVGDDAEIIFGAVNEPAMQGEIRVTVIATGFDHGAEGVGADQLGNRVGAQVFDFRKPAVARGALGRLTQAGEAARRPQAPVQPKPERPRQDLTDMEIPTFIRRQMD